jgi:hypothetical protein
MHGPEEVLVHVPHITAAGATANAASARGDHCRYEKSKVEKVASKRATAVDAYIGARIRERRHDLKMSQHALGKAPSVTFQPRYG